MRYYCTYFDSNYLLKGVALYQSLDEHSHEPFILWVLCFDDRTYQILYEMALPKMRLIAQKDFEFEDEELLQAKQNRTTVEYYWTCTPSLPLFIFKHNPHIDLIIYLDADLYFFSDPTPIFDELGSGSILLVGHRFPPELSYKEPYGIYNVSMLCFRRDQNGLAALYWWREQCNEWCFMRLENGKYGDQKYLDDWPTRFENVVVLQHKGAGLAAWNLAGYTTSIQGKQVFVDDDPLIFYHFHLFKMLTDHIFILGADLYLQSFDYKVLNYQHIKYLFTPYAQKIRKIGEKIRGHRSDYRNLHEKTSLLQFLIGLSKGRYFLAYDNIIAHLMASIDLWLGGGILLACKGFRLYEKGNRRGALKALVAAACRSPSILFNPMFWRVVKH